jgi:prophage antirepressor-like protein
MIADNNLIELQKVREENFGMVSCDFYENKNSDEIYMTTRQLGEALEYANPRQAITNIVNRNPYLKDSEFSGVLALSTPSGTQDTRVFTEDGVLEITIKSNQPKAVEFRRFVRNILKKLRTNGVVRIDQNNNSYLDAAENIIKAIRQNEEKLNNIEQNQKQQQTLLEEQQKNLDHVNDIISVKDTASLRKKFTSAVPALAHKLQIPYPEAYHIIYKRINKNRSINLKARANNRNMQVIDYLENEDLLEYAMRILNGLLNKTESN